MFFSLLGVTVGIFTGSFTLGKAKWLSNIIPSVTAATTTCFMYIGEMILLNGHLYRFGKGFFFDGLGKAVLAPADVLVIAASFAITMLICIALNKENKKA